MNTTLALFQRGPWSARYSGYGLNEIKMSCREREDALQQNTIQATKR